MTLNLLNVGNKPVPDVNQKLIEQHSNHILQLVYAITKDPNLRIYAEKRIEYFGGKPLSVESSLLTLAAIEPNWKSLSKQTSEAWKGETKAGSELTHDASNAPKDTVFEFEYALREQDAKFLCAFALKIPESLTEAQSAKLIEYYHRWLRSRNMAIGEGSRIFAANAEGVIIRDTNGQPRQISTAEFHKTLEHPELGFVAFLKKNNLLDNISIKHSAYPEVFVPAEAVKPVAAPEVRVTEKVSTSAEVSATEKKEKKEKVEKSSTEKKQGM